MRIWNRFFFGLISLIVLFATAQLIILAYGLWMQQRYAYGTLFFILAVFLFLWPDPADRKINSKVPNPYHNGN